MPPQIPKETLLADIKQVANILGESPTALEYSEYGNYGVTTVQSKFGKWNNALTEAGLPINQEERATTGALLADIERVATALEKTPTQQDYREHGKYTTQTAIDRFGSWNTALAEIGREPNREVHIPREELLSELRRLGDDGIGPSADKINQEGQYSVVPYSDKFGGVWNATVRAGLEPRVLRPLCPSAYQNYHTTASGLSPETAVIALLTQFTALDSALIAQFSKSWQASRTDKRIIKVPKELTDSELTWMFRIPETWINPETGEEYQTHLPELLDWYWDHYETCHLTQDTIKKTVLRVAQEAGLSEYRPEVTTRVGKAPDVQFNDLTITHGINLARRNVRADAINQRLGLEYRDPPHLNIRKIFVWCDHHYDDFSHPDWNQEKT